MPKKFLSFVYFLITVSILIVALKIINWLPLTFQKETMQRYSSLEEVRARLNIKEIFIPSYFPQSLTWPPSEILAQGKPFTAIIMEFRNVQSGDITLTVSQADSQDFIPDKKIKILQIRERVSYSLKGRDAIIEAGVCKDDAPCSQISWNEGRYRVNVVMRSTPHDLIRIADSMIH
jgi:hypothetical protein